MCNLRSCSLWHKWTVCVEFQYNRYFPFPKLQTKSGEKWRVWNSTMGQYGPSSILVKHTSRLQNILFIRCHVRTICVFKWKPKQVHMNWNLTCQIPFFERTTHTSWTDQSNSNKIIITYKKVKWELSFKIRADLISIIYIDIGGIFTLACVRRYIHNHTRVCLYVCIFAIMLFLMENKVFRRKKTKDRQAHLENCLYWT